MIRQFWGAVSFFKSVTIEGKYRTRKQFNDTDCRIDLVISFGCESFPIYIKLTGKIRNEEILRRYRSPQHNGKAPLLRS